MVSPTDASGMANVALLRQVPVALATALSVKVLVVLLLAGFAGPVPKDDRLDPANWVSVMDGVLISPALETLVFCYLVHLFTQIGRRRWPGLVVSAALFSALHLVNSWQNAVTVFWSFGVQGFYFLRLRDQGASLKQRLLFVFLVHAINNGLVFVLIALTGS